MGSEAVVDMGETSNDVEQALYAEVRALYVASESERGACFGRIAALGRRGEDLEALLDSAPYQLVASPAQASIIETVEAVALRARRARPTEEPLALEHDDLDESVRDLGARL